ncbi:Metallo-hydrolase/oxidoreductase [Anaeromyces robustus]|uniref:Cleavage and polyadenylation specificity factor subunit 2 n=1 Tax=Anaeromyces robustus TaxID=1754192 RepID=A0A1Y1XRS7_9FUNG|nr:Metallo-hydrolase/oxidoreductase [Anaeromyces robustus]|eukprot:ORX87994.1 Metallo-hydrolase/oxidoreductase [Anaeromyces robustus]
MTSYIKFTALSGARDDNPLCYLLEIDEAKILLDCGWYDTFDEELLKPLSEIANKIDAILLSHADIEHIGALPYAMSKFNMSCSIYATIPVQNMGQMCLYDAVQSHLATEDFTKFSLDDIDNTFEKIIQLRYQQPFSLTGKCKGIIITAYSAGHSLGGTIWKIKKDTDEILYAVNYNHKKERHLEGTQLHLNSELFARPSLLITDSRNSLNIQPSRKQRDNFLIDIIFKTLSKKGNVLIPVDSTTRILELAYILDQHWGNNKISFPLVVFTHQGYRTIQFAKSMLEWMSDSLLNIFSQTRENPFELKHIKLKNKLQDVEELKSPKVVLASMKSLETGYARDLFINWSKEKNNIIIFPSKCQPNTLSKKLYDLWYDIVKDKEIKSRIPLEGEELKEFLRLDQIKKEKEAAEAAQRKHNLLIMEDDDNDDNDDNDEIDVNLLNTQFDLYVRDTNNMDYSTNMYYVNQSYKMYPCNDQKKKFDDYGEVINAELYTHDEFQAAEVENTYKNEEDPEREAEMSIPSKCVSHMETVPIKCKICYIDFEGLSDGKSIKNIIPQVSPKKLILIHGNEEQTLHLQEFCKSVISNGVEAPHVGECINVSAATNIYQIKLTDTLMDDYELAFIQGQIELNDMNQNPVLDIIPPEEKNKNNSYIPSIITGDLKLSEFKKLLQHEGYNAEFIPSGLLVNESILIQKNDAGKLIIEGSLSSEYYKVRTLLYNQFAIL